MKMINASTKQAMPTAGEIFCSGLALRTGLTVHSSMTHATVTAFRSPLAPNSEISEYSQRIMMPSNQ